MKEEYYWVKYQKKWTVGQYDSEIKMWYIIGKGPYMSSDLDYISPNPIPEPNV